MAVGSAGGQGPNFRCTAATVDDVNAPVPMTTLPGRVWVLFTRSLAADATEDPVSDGHNFYPTQNPQMIYMMQPDIPITMYAGTLTQTVVVGIIDGIPGPA